MTSEKMQKQPPQYNPGMLTPVAGLPLDQPWLEVKSIPARRSVIL
jgi:hypothetical protein